jgi:hypothetical protein
VLLYDFLIVVLSFPRWKKRRESQKSTKHKENIIYRRLKPHLRLDNVLFSSVTWGETKNEFWFSTSFSSSSSIGSSDFLEMGVFGGNKEFRVNCSEV